MKHLSIVLASLLQGGCGVYECLDSKVVREVKPINKEFNIQLLLNDKSMDMNIRCEEYYEAMCNERGNYWSIREVGKDTESQRSTFVINDHKLGKVEFPAPYCKSLVRGGGSQLDGKLISIDGEPYWLRSSNGTRRTFKSSSGPNKKEKAVDIDLQLKINGVSVE